MHCKNATGFVDLKYACSSCSLLLANLSADGLVIRGFDYLRS